MSLNNAKTCLEDVERELNVDTPLVKPTNRVRFPSRATVDPQISLRLPL